MERCAYCDGLIDPVPVDGTDPDNADEYWYETYECDSCGATGQLEVTEPAESNGWQRSERKTGILKETTP